MRMRERVLGDFYREPPAHFKVEIPGKVFVTDVTEFNLGKIGKVYLSPVMDLYNREIVGYDKTRHPDFAQTRRMMKEAFEGRKIAEGALFHSDQGWQYQMKEFGDMLADLGITQSMSRKGNCLDNAKTENFFSRLKKEMFYGHEKEFRCFAEFRKAIDEYIRWYNNERIVERFGCAPVGHRNIVPIPMLCYSSV